MKEDEEIQEASEEWVCSIKSVSSLCKSFKVISNSMSHCDVGSNTIIDSKVQDEAIGIAKSLANLIELQISYLEKRTREEND